MVLWDHPDARSYMVVFQRARAAVLELGARMVARGQLREASDVFLLEYNRLVSYFYCRGFGHHSSPSGVSHLLGGGLRPCAA
jgi:hypothetical protein